MKSNEWYTPAKYIEAARQVMGRIDLDPASCYDANLTVKANQYYDKTSNGLMQPWYGCVWLNPPYGRTEGRNCSNLEAFTRRLIFHYEEGLIEQAIYLTYVDTSTRWFQLCFAYPICFCKGRVSFDSHSPALTPAKNGMYPVCFVYLGPHEARFIDIFSRFGTVARRVSVPRPTPIMLELF